MNTLVCNNMGWGIIHKNLMVDTDLSIEAKGIFAYLVTYAGNGNTAFPSRDLICYHLGIGKDRYYRHMKSLQEKGYVTIQQTKSEDGRFNHNIYILNPYPDFTDTVETCNGIKDTNINNINKNNNKNNNNISKEAVKAITPKNKKTMPLDDKDRIWKMYPRKEGKKKAYSYMDRLIKEGYTVEQIEAATQRYISILEAKKTERQYIKMGSGFFNEKIYDFLENEEGTSNPSGEYIDKGTGEFGDFAEEWARQMNPDNMFGR